MYILQVLIFSKQNLHLFKIQNKNYTSNLWNGDNLKCVSHNLRLFKSYPSTNYNTRKVIELVTGTTKKITDIWNVQKENYKVFY